MFDAAIAAIVKSDIGRSGIASDTQFGWEIIGKLLRLLLDHARNMQRCCSRGKLATLALIWKDRIQRHIAGCLAPGQLRLHVFMACVDGGLHRFFKILYRQIACAVIRCVDIGNVPGKHAVAT